MSPLREYTVEIVFVPEFLPDDLGEFMDGLSAMGWLGPSISVQPDQKLVKVLGQIVSLDPLGAQLKGHRAIRQSLLAAHGGLLGGKLSADKADFVSSGAVPFDAAKLDEPIVTPV